MSVIMQLKGALAEKKQTRMDLSVRIDAKVKAVKDLLAVSAVTPVAELDLAAAALFVYEALELQKELKGVLLDIQRLGRELGNG